MNIFSHIIPLLKRLIYSIVYTNLLVAFIAFCITFAVATYVGSSNTWEYGTIAFGATLFSYNLQRIHRLNDFQETNSLRHKWLFNHVIVLKLLSLIGALGACTIYFYTCFNWSSFVLLGALTIISFLYAYRGRNKSFKPLRDIPFIKIHLIALTWVVVVFLWPVIDAGALTLSNGLVAIGLYLYFIAITIPFDIRDLAYDLDEQATFPQVLGVKKSLLLAKGCIVFAALCFFIGFPFVITNPYFYLAFLGHFLFIHFTTSKRPDLYFSLGIDGWLIWLALMIYSF